VFRQIIEMKKARVPQFVDEEQTALLVDQVKNDKPDWLRYNGYQGA
jgi:hypothetical protein